MFSPIKSPLLLTLPPPCRQSSNCANALMPACVASLATSALFPITPGHRVAAVPEGQP